jgi:Uma2 family endonuclease
MTVTIPATAPEVDPTKPPPAEYLPDYDQFVTEDDAPVDNFFSEKQQRLLTEPLYSARVAERLGRPLLAAANVGVFYGEGQPAIVPDALVSLDVELAADLWPKPNRSYFIWRFGKPPDAVVEIVSNREGGELGSKRERYAQLGVAYYVVFDPQRVLGEELLRCYELRGRTYAPCAGGWLGDVGLGVRLWEGEYEGVKAVWLRWCDQEGNVIPTGAELAEAERQRAEEEQRRAEEARQRAEAERQRAEEEQRRAEEARQRAEAERARAEEEQQRAEEARQRAEAERARAEEEQRRAEEARQRAEAERQRAERLAARLRALGIDPDAEGI